jgi:hypothetical protein
MTKLSIEIEKLTSVDACCRALERVYEAIKECQGESHAQHIFWCAVHGFPSSPKNILRRATLDICFTYEAADLRLALEYYSMPKPNRQRLATELARKNETLPPERRYGPRGSTSPMTMLKQINRVLRKIPRSEIADLSGDQRQEVLKVAETNCFIRAYERKLNNYRAARGGAPL